VMAELLERLTAAGVTFTDSELSETFAIPDSACIVIMPETPDDLDR
jgi:hypothetical protein